jgi:hypothetical protein
VSPAVGYTYCGRLEIPGTFEMLQKRKILGTGFASFDEALEPLRLAASSWKDIHGSIAIPDSIFECTRPTYGKYGGKFRLKARVSMQETNEGVSAVLILDVINAREVANFILSAAFVPVIVAIGNINYLWSGIVVGFLSVGIRLIFFVLGVENITQSFTSAYGAESFAVSRSQSRKA